MLKPKRVGIYPVSPSTKKTLEETMQANNGKLYDGQLVSTEDQDFMLLGDGVEAGDREVAVFPSLNALQKSLPIYPYIQTGEHNLSVTDNGDGTITVDENQSFVMRGIVRILTSDYSVVQRTFTVDADKTYHLRFSHLDDDNKGKHFALNDLSDIGYNPDALVSTDSLFATTFDDLLVATASLGVISIGGDVVVVGDLGVNNTELASIAANNLSYFEDSDNKYMVSPSVDGSGFIYKREGDAWAAVQTDLPRSDGAHAFKKPDGSMSLALINYNNQKLEISDWDTATETFSTGNPHASLSVATQNYSRAVALFMYDFGDDGVYFTTNTIGSSGSGSSNSYPAKMFSVGGDGVITEVLSHGITSGSSAGMTMARASDGNIYAVANFSYGSNAYNQKIYKRVSNSEFVDHLIWSTGSSDSLAVLFTQDGKDFISYKDYYSNQYTKKWNAVDKTVEGRVLTGLGGGAYRYIAGKLYGNDNGDVVSFDFDSVTAQASNRMVLADDFQAGGITTASEGANDFLVLPHFLTPSTNTRAGNSITTPLGGN